MQQGIFLAIDGSDGTGKTKLIQGLYENLTNHGKNVIILKEPTNSIIGKLIKENDFRGMTLACLVGADRHNHIITEVLPALEKGFIVILDRYIASSYVCQQLDGIDMEIIENINYNIIKPDAYIFLNAELNVIKKRLSKRTSLSRMEREFSIEESLDLFEEAKKFLISKNFNNVITLTSNSEDEYINNLKYILEIILKWEGNNSG